MNRSIQTLANWLRLVGLVSTLHWSLIRLRGILGLGEPMVWQVRPRQVQHTLTARLHGASDMNVFWQIFVFEEYACLRKLENVRSVLDLGANVGFSSTYLLSCFAEATVVAVEPDAANFAICKSNLDPYGKRATVLHGAVWSRSGLLSLSKDTAGAGLDWARQVAPPPEGVAGNVHAWDVGSLIEMSGRTVVDLLKVDVEGAELEVFGVGSRTWLPQVRNICIELHGPECERAFFNALADFNYTLEHSGELTICRDISLKQAGN